MANRIFKLLSADSVSFTQIRHKYMRGKPPTIARSLQQRIEEMEYKDPEIHFKVDIGFPVPKFSRTQMTEAWTKEIVARRKDPLVEQQARRNQLNIDLDKAKKDWYMTNAPHQIRTIAQHYGIYDDLYGDAYFHPIVPLTIDYDFGSEDKLARVHRGNLIKSYEAKNAPSVTYKAEPDSLYTLLLTTPDGNFSDPSYEYCHWFIGNIPGNDVAKGEQLVDYLRPIPPKGIGFCRYIFVLYKQDKKIDFSEYKKEIPCLKLTDRDWKTYDFIRKHQDYMTPAGLAFFQCDYDISLKDFYHNVLQMEQPTFEYDFPKPYLNPQVWFPIKKPFNDYMDKYRDSKQINKEYLLRRLKNEHPFKFPDPPLKYPNAHPFKGYSPSWLRLVWRKERLGIGRINDHKLQNF
ncbi:39S ribosomal protein L38, mitochondrial [Nasonia vitripennis]|uniref:Large ribosomal subunit protein mL38 n=1 Tax=Nasonia vitripennis TaxID=7425 RepID=A0A7M7IYD5_NASVI|nr:39S ribosomal protein L38, mitochondrial [Nasonia vitripennis]